MEAAPDSSVVVVLTTVPDRASGEALAERLVAERLVACANLVPDVRSIYRWEGEVQSDGELLMVLKTRGDALTRLKVRLPQLHPYELPELIALPVLDGSEAYLGWVRSEVEGA